ncbi:glycosyltransferase family 4 protein [Pseudofulvibacter geojedonensis]|uniref:Glycosyltransferase family 4 protein n=1 Tax=Pseudofulvibacter geojedonensis TaxID=1123758 RepID=A0ABW3I454_9FLAO
MSRKDILIISNYFPPETGAAPNRIYSLAENLTKNGYNTTVLCPLPNYPFGSIFKEYKGSFIKKTNEDDLTVYRLWLWANNSKNKFIRLFSMLSFSLTLFFFLLFKKTPKKVIIQCSPLFVGFFAVLVSKLKGKKVILNVSDLWPLAGLEMGILNKGFYYSILEKIEVFNYKNSHLIMGQSEEILTHISKKMPDKNTFLYRNYPDFKTPIIQGTKSSEKIKIVYAGLLGIAQGIYKICQEIELPKNIEFHIYGNGPEAELITKIAQEKDNIFYHNSISREKLHEELQEYQLTLIPLKNRIYGSVPSKIFEYSRLGLPILYLSEGEGSDLVVKNKLGYSIASNDFKALNEFLESLNNKSISLPLKTDIIDTVERNFDLDIQFKKFLQSISIF